MSQKQGQGRLIYTNLMMKNSIDDNLLIRQAQQGDRESQDRLAELACKRMMEYVYRLTLREDLAQDIVQECMLDMFRVLGRLDRVDRFWPWLRKIAFNKVHDSFKATKRQKATSLSKVWHQKSPANGPEEKCEGLSRLVSEELAQIVHNAIQELKPHYRSVLVLRSYEEMEYSEIAEMMHCSEFYVRKLFYRAKKALQKQLSRQGFGKGALLTALVLFGKMTATSKAAAGSVNISSATLKVGTCATLAGAAGTKMGIVTLTAAGLLAAGSAAVPLCKIHKQSSVGMNSSVTQDIAGKHVPAPKTTEEWWYYYPEGVKGAVMMRGVKWDEKEKQFYCRWLQNDNFNYCYDKSRNTIHINNHRMWNQDLSVRRLPTDKPELSEFISRVEKQESGMVYVPDKGKSLWVIVKEGGMKKDSTVQVHYHYNIREEEYFQDNWHTGVKEEDHRDLMHKRGWGTFRVEGEINGEKVSGAGITPFVYPLSKQMPPQLRLRIGDDVQIVDGPGVAYARNAKGEMVTFPSGSFWVGLARPWMGLHCIDTVRRDAAEKEIWFETRYPAGKERAEVVLRCQPDMDLVYTINMKKDIIEQIQFVTKNKSGRSGGGLLRFIYSDNVDADMKEYVEPTITNKVVERSDSVGILWLRQMVKGELGN